jgi:transcriptional regulator with XRE-family HTH domain
MTFSQLVKTRRLELGISQLKLSKLLGYNEPYFLSNIENGRSKFPRKKLKRLRKILFLDNNVLVDVLMCDERLKIYQLLGLK